MQIAYKTLVTVNVQHPYYSDGLCPDLEFFPVAHTKRLVEQYRLQVVQTGSGFKILYRADQQGEPISGTASNQEFVMGVRVKNSRFNGVTTMPFSPRPDEVHHIQSGTVQTVPALIYPKVFNVHVEDLPSITGGHEMTLAMEPIYGGGSDLIDENTYTVPQGQTFFTSPQIDTYPASYTTDESIYQIELYSNETSIGDSGYLYDGNYILVNPELDATSFWGIWSHRMNIDLASTDTVINVDFASFVRSSVWDYYLVIKTDPGQAYTIDETESFSFAENTGFPTTAPEVTKEAELLEGRPAGSIVQHFQSDAPVPMKETPYELELKLGTATVLSRLPNVKASSTRPEVVVYV